MNMNATQLRDALALKKPFIKSVIAEDNEFYSVTVQCVFGGGTHTIIVPIATLNDWYKWLMHYSGGTPLMANGLDEDRAELLISGVCKGCFDNEFRGDE